MGIDQKNRGIQVLFNCPELQPLDLQIIEKIEASKMNLGYAVQTPRRWTGILRRTTLGRAIQGSNSIEGYKVTDNDALAAVRGEELSEADEDSRKAVTGYQQAMTYVIQLADDPTFNYSTWLIRGLHFMMIQHDLDKHPGKWRPGPIFVYDEEQQRQVYEGPDAILVPQLMDELVENLGSDDTENSIVRGAMAHLNLAMIHPFSDGNGRMARCLQTLVLARSRIIAPPYSSIEEYLGRNQRAYYDILAQVGKGSFHPDNDALPWVRFCITAHYRQVHTLLRRMREIAVLWDALEKEATRHGFSERTVTALTEAALGLRVKNAGYRLNANISNDVASRELKALADAGLLVGHGERRGRYYEAGVPLQRIRMATRMDGNVADPYEEFGAATQPMLPGFQAAPSPAPRSISASGPTPPAPRGNTS